MSSLQKIYLTLNLSGTTYTPTVAKQKTTLAVYSIPTSLLTFRDPNNFENIQIHHTLEEKLHAVLKTSMDTDTTNTIQPAPIFYIEGTKYFLLPHTGNMLAYESTTAGALEPSDGKFRGCKYLFIHKICELTNTKPANNLYAKFQYGGQDVFVVLSSQTRTVPISQYKGLIQSGGDGTYDEWCLTDFITYITTDDTRALPPAPMAGVYSQYAQSCANGMLKTSEYHGRSHINSLLYSEAGTSPKMLVLKNSGTLGQLLAGKCALMYRRGFMLFKLQADLSDYTTGGTYPAEYETVDVVDYTTKNPSPERFFVTVPQWLPSDQGKNELFSQNTWFSQSAGSYYFLIRALVHKGYADVTLYEDKNVIPRFPADVVLMTTAWMYTKCPAMLGGGNANMEALRIQARFGMLAHVGRVDDKFYTSGQICEGDATLDFSTTSTYKGMTGRIVDLKMVGSTQYFYEAYNVVVGFMSYNLTLDTEYGVVYEDNTSEVISITKENQGGNINGWFTVNATGTTIIATTKPNTHDADSDASCSAVRETLYNMPVGTKLVPNASNKKIRYVFFRTHGGGTNVSQNKDILLGICLSPKTP